MPAECHYSMCPFHGEHELPPVEGPFCFELACKATNAERAMYAVMMRDQTVRSAITGGKIIGFLDNQWRQRKVTVYSVPHDAGIVVSVGIPYDGSAPIICVEDKSLYLNCIQVFPEAYVYR